MKMKRVSRNRVRVSYYEPEEPGFDEYIFCSSCAHYVYEYCSIHGPLLIIPDDEVSTPTGFPAIVPRAALTIPRLFLHLAPSTIPGAGIGVFSTLTLPPGVRFGPYRGLKTEESHSTYCWQIFDRDHKPAHVLDARDPNKSNWMRYVNCSRHHTEQNLVAYQYRGQLYYRTIRIIPRFSELLVYYGSHFAHQLGIDIRRYHAPVYADILVNTEHGAQKYASQSIDNEDTSIGDVQEGVPQNSITQEFTIEDICETKVYIETNSINELEDLNNKNVEVNDEKKVQCDGVVFNDCGQALNKKAAVTDHMAHTAVKKIDYKINKNRVNLCLICNCTFETKSQLINHEIQIHDSKIVYKACSQCDYKTRNSGDYNRHVDRHNKNAQKIACEMCHLRFDDVNKLTIHQGKHGDSKNARKIACEICGLKFNDVNKLTIHSKIHAADRQFACTICGCRFKTNYNLKLHSAIHSEQKPYTCKTCNKSFSRKYSLTRHLKLHMHTPSAIAVELTGPSMSTGAL